MTDAFNKDRFSSLYHNMKPGKERYSNSCIKLFKFFFSYVFTKSQKSISRELQTTVDNYVPMYSSTTRGQEAIALLTLNSDDMDSFEGKKQNI